MTSHDIHARFGRPIRPELPTVAYLTNQLPFPAHSGGQVREAQLLARLSQHYNICLGAVTTEFERDVLNIESSLEICSEVLLGRAADLGGGSGHRRLVDSPAFTPEWAWRAKAADLVHSEGYFLMHHIPPDCPIVLVAENVEYALHRARTGDAGAEPEDWTRTRDREVSAWRRAAVCGTVSEPDLQLLLETAPDVPACLTPNGWDHLADVLPINEPPAPATSPTLVYTGNYSWEPTADGADFLLSEIWPLVRARDPRVRLIVAGANPTTRMRELAAGDERIEITGRLPSLMTVLEQATVYVCPMRFSGGTEVKLVEALYAGLAVVSTPDSLAGLPQRCHDAVLVGEGALDLAELCLRLLADEQLRQRQVGRTREAVAEMPTWDDAAVALEKAWLQAMP